jgi:hypothetical protein
MAAPRIGREESGFLRELRARNEEQIAGLTHEEAFESLLRLLGLRRERGPWGWEPIYYTPKFSVEEKDVGAYLRNFKFTPAESRQIACAIAGHVRISALKAFAESLPMGLDGHVCLLTVFMEEVRRRLKRRYHLAEHPAKRTVTLNPGLRWLPRVLEVYYPGRVKMEEGAEKDGANEARVKSLAWYALKFREKYGAGVLRGVAGLVAKQQHDPLWPAAVESLVSGERAASR